MDLEEKLRDAQARIAALEAAIQPIDKAWQERWMTADNMLHVAVSFGQIRAVSEVYRAALAGSPAEKSKTRGA